MKRNGGEQRELKGKEGGARGTKGCKELKKNEGEQRELKRDGGGVL